MFFEPYCPVQGSKRSVFAQKTVCWLFFAQVNLLSVLYLFLSHCSIQAKGKALQNALSSLQQLDRALDRFLVWLSQSESTLESLETEIGKFGERSLRQRPFIDQIRVNDFFYPFSALSSFD